MALDEACFDVRTAGDGDRALLEMRAWRPDVVVLDLNIPGPNGLEVCRRMRDFSNAYVLMLTARADEVDKLVGLSAGADDYLTKPFAFAELVARIGALGRRVRPALPPVLDQAGVQLDTARRFASRDGRPLKLAPKEFAVLGVLMRAEGAVVTTEQLLEKAWDEHADPFTNAVRVAVMTLRRKLGSPPLIHTVAGAGYRFDS